MKRKNLLWRTALIVFFLNLEGCTVGPNFHRDHMKIPQEWTEKVGKHPATAQEIAQAANDMRRWWEQFHDPLLNRLVEQAIQGNYDLKIAGQRILAAQALRDREAANWYPQIDATAGYGYAMQSYTRSDTKTFKGVADNNTSIRRFGISFNWQLDAFGLIRREVESQEEAVKASIEDRRAVLLTMLSQLANDYVTLRAMQLRLKIVEENVTVARYVYDLTQKEYTQGTGTTLETVQAQAELEAQTAAKEPLKTNITQITHAIDVLLGQAPGTIEAELKIDQPLPTLPSFPSSLPSIVLANRPDIRNAEREYAIATANVGIAVAQLYPQFSLNLSAIPSSAKASELADAASLVSEDFLNASLPLFHGGQLSAQVHEAQANAESARLDYRQTVLNALREVEDVIAAWGDDAEHVKLLHESKLSSQLALFRAQKLYKAGLVGYIEVLTAQRTAINSENAETIARLDRLQDAVNLFTALGAGWQGVPLTNTELPVSLSQQNTLAKFFSQ